MIPAVLSVVFVVYLYQKLNQQSEPLQAETTDSRSGDQAEELMNRIRAIQLRIEQLVKPEETGGTNQ